MAEYKIHSISTYDARFALPLGAGTDSIHETSEYCLATTLLSTNNGARGSGFVLTLGDGNTLVCKAIEMLAKPLEGMTIEAVMADFGNISRKIADHAALRWLGTAQGRCAIGPGVYYQRVLRPMGQEPGCAAVEAVAGSHPGGVGPGS